MEIPMTNISSTKQRTTLSIKIAKQIFIAIHPYGLKRTNGEKNEDAHFIENQKYHENIMDLVDQYTANAVLEANINLIERIEHIEDGHYKLIVWIPEGGDDETEIDIDDYSRRLVKLLAQQKEINHG